ncbi:hypothetical protein N9878_01135 [bacterium]|nr:hypothetical protein [bacterium]
MPLSEQERIDLKAGMIVMENTIATLSEMQASNTQAQTKLTEQIGELVTAMSNRDIKDEFFRNKITKMEDNQTKAMDLFLPVINRARSNQERWDKFYNSATTTWGKLAGTAILILLAMAMGADLEYFRSFFKL